MRSNSAARLPSQRALCVNVRKLQDAANVNNMHSWAVESHDPHSDAAFEHWICGFVTVWKGTRCVDSESRSGLCMGAIRYHLLQSIKPAYEGYTSSTRVPRYRRAMRI